MKSNNKKVLAALSGGVDSAVIAAILKQDGFNVSGLFLNLGQVNKKEDEKNAKLVAKKLKIPLKIVNIKKEFKKEVIDYFLKEYASGNTPNPCIMCNKKIKFGLLYHIAKKEKFDYLATGHYIRKLQINSKNKIQKSKVIYKIYKAKDKKKDQSYFLYNLKQSQLEYLIFPLGKYLKDDIIKIAKKLNLPVSKKESQDICFLKGIDHNLFLKKHLNLKIGDIITIDGKKIGKHEGLPLYTVGQRRQIKIGGIGPFYAVKMDYKKNILIVTDKFDDKILYKKELEAKSLNWIAKQKPKLPLKCEAKIRYLHPTQNCVVFQEKNKYRIKFLKPQRAVTPGQSIVFYKKNELLGGGIIK
ncbi:MAG: tRNA 2-thiouridine(34) synthase MnmA [Patescibacteria group bacterium]|nr:tRNA 2-thiouridine(34) synthase MnmA [Patescibacteria group bacterium]